MAAARRLAIGPSSSGSGDGIFARFSNSDIVVRGRQVAGQVAGDASFVTKKLLKSTGKAAWIAGTSILILVVPLMIALEREQQFNELEMQQNTLLGTSSMTPPPPPSK